MSSLEPPVGVSYDGPIVPEPTYLPGPRPTPGPQPPVPGVQWPSPTPGGQGLEYHQLFRAGRGSSWRWGPLVGAPVIAALLILVLPFVMSELILAWTALSGSGAGQTRRQLEEFGQGKSSPVGLLWALGSLALVIPVVWLVVRLVHGLAPRWTTSVGPGLRWGLLLACFGAAFVAIFARILVSGFLPVVPDDIPLLEPVSWSNRVRDLLLITLLVTPFQAAAEEYLFRGYLTQAVGGWFRGRLARVVAVVVPATLFALAHGQEQSLPVFLDRFAFGVVAGVLVLLTGGLEAGIAAHILNNWVALFVAVAFGTLDQALNPGQASYWLMAATLTQQLTYLGLVWLVVRWLKVRRVSEPGVLAAPRELV